MLDITNIQPPAAVKEIERETAAIGFTMSSDLLTGSLLRTLAASKPNGLCLELGTGTGMGTSWLLDGMDAASKLISVDQNEETTAIARRHLGHDPRVTFHVIDGAAFIQSCQGPSFDLIFADMLPGKFTHLDDILSLLKPGGLYVIDDLLPQPGWAEDHLPKVADLVQYLAKRPDFSITSLDWSTGLIIATKR